MKSKVLAGSILVVAFFLGVANAQVDPSPGVGRISLIHGDVSVQRGDSGEWAAAALNQPVVSGDKVSTGERSRSEVQLDYANILRLGDGSQATIASLTRTQIQIEVGAGLADYSVFKGAEADAEINTPNVAIRPSLKEGVYRIEVNGGETRLIVRKGEAEISTPQGSTRVERGQEATIRGTGEETEYKIADAPANDSWDSWNNDRNGIIRNAQAWGRTDRYYVGSEDLDAYGHWTTVPDYGPVWAPVVPIDWAPYRAGRWVWEPYWGWTWVSYEPWGWAPYHYGRWFLYGSSWVWWPGPVYGYPAYRPIWAPAYVSFFGFGGNFGFGVGFGFGSFGWLPVGPCDPYYPWYGRYGSRFNVVNVTNVTNITNITNINNVNGRRILPVQPLHGGTRFSNLRLVAGNERVRNALSTVPAGQFGTGRITPTPVGQDTFRNGRVMTGNLPVVPTRETLTVSNRPASPSTIHGGQSETFFTKGKPVGRPQPFEQQAAQVQQAIQRSGQFSPIRPGISGNTSEAARSVSAPSRTAGGIGPAQPSGPNRSLPTKQDLGGATSGRVMGDSGRAVRPGTPNNGWNRFGSEMAVNRPMEAPPQSSSKPKPSSEQPTKAEPKNATPSSDASGWHRFSGPGGGQAVPSAQQPGPAQGRPSGPSNTVAPRAGGAVDRSDGWRHFPPRQSEAQPGSPASGSPNRGSQANDGWNRLPSRGEVSTPQPRSREERSFPGGGVGRGSRPPLDLRQPIVMPRSSPGMGSPQGPSRHGGGEGRPQSGAPSRGSGSSGAPHSTSRSR